MKKTLALIMALALVLCSASAFAAREKDAYTWAKSLPDGAKFMFDYSRMQPVPAVKIKNGYMFYDLQTTSATTYNSNIQVITAGNVPNDAVLKVNPITGLPYVVNFANLSKAELAYYNERIDSGEYGVPYQVPAGAGAVYGVPDGTWILDSQYVGVGGKYTVPAGSPDPGERFYPVPHDNVPDDQDAGHDYEDFFWNNNGLNLNFTHYDGVETMYPEATTPLDNPVTGDPVARENDGIEATFTKTATTKSTPYGVGIEYAYSPYGPKDPAWSAAEKSTLVPVMENGQPKTITDDQGKTMYVYVNKEVSNTPAANVASTTSTTDNFISTAFAAGFLASELNPDASSDQTLNVVPVDLTEDGTYVYPIVSKAHTIVGLVWATVEDGYVTIDGQLRDQVKRYGDDFTLKIYTSTDELANGGTDYEIGEPIAIEELGDAMLFAIQGKVQYHWAIGASKANGYSIYWTLQDYGRNETTWKLYRNSLRDIVDLMAAAE